MNREERMSGEEEWKGGVEGWRVRQKGRDIKLKITYGQWAMGKEKCG